MAVKTVTHSNGDLVLRAAKFVQAARRCATDATLDAAHHRAALKAAILGEQWLYIQYGVRLP